MSAVNGDLQTSGSHAGDLRLFSLAASERNPQIKSSFTGSRAIKRCMPTNDMNELSNWVAEMALRVAELPAAEAHNDSKVLDAIEQLARRILKEVEAARAHKVKPLGETSGSWRAMQPTHR
jgi:hypothetical protein